MMMNTPTRFTPPLPTITLLALAVLCGCGAPSNAQQNDTASATAAKPDLTALQRVDETIEAAIKRGDAPGAVLLVGHKGQTIYRKAYGHRAVKPAEVAMTPDTIFDLASLTKPVACATSVLLLVERGKIALDDPIAKHMPEFGANGKDTITVQQLLTHCGGLIADNALRDYEEGKQQAWRNICALKPTAPPGSRFVYSDVGFIVLGELVERVEGKRLNHFARESIFETLGMSDTDFKPAEEKRARCAPTQQREGKWMQGDVHDPRAWWLESVAGHAGLFGTADDLAKYCWMLLRGGEFNGKRVMKPETVAQMIRGRWLPDGTNGRGLGWDVDTAYSSPRGERFPRGVSFGHTGFTGTSIWIDPASDSFVILLTSRVHPDGKGDTIKLRRDVATIVANAILGSSPEAKSVVLTGMDVLQRDQFAALKGRRIALITNHTGRNRSGARTIDLLHAAQGAAGFQFVRIFSPEHGLYGALDEKVGNTVEEKTKLPVFSLYGDTQRPTNEMLEGIDTIVYDIQDIGTRFYTYISTLGYAMEEAAKAGVRVVVLDRPNPIAPRGIDGPIADADRLSFVCYKPIPLVHGMTVGELAQYFNKEHKISCDLHVVKMEGWKRSMWFDDTGLTLVNPSPNMRNSTQALIYPAVGMLETTNLSVGRGTEQPFEFFGAPWIDGSKLAASLNSLKLPGIRFVPIEFTPTASKFKGELCRGVYCIITDREKFEPSRTGLSIAWTLMRQHGRSFDCHHMLRLLCNHATYEAMMAAQGPSEIAAKWKASLSTFDGARKAHLMYE